MVIIKMFPNKLPSKIKQSAQSLENLSADESTKEHVEFIWSCADFLEISGIVALPHNNNNNRTISARASKTHPL